MALSSILQILANYIYQIEVCIALQDLAFFLSTLNAYTIVASFHFLRLPIYAEMGV